MLLPRLPVLYNQWPCSTWKNALEKNLWTLPTLQKAKIGDVVGVAASAYRTSKNTLGINHMKYLLSTGGDWYQEVNLEKAMDSKTPWLTLCHLADAVQNISFTQNFPEDMWGISWNEEPLYPKDPRELIIMNGMIAFMDTPIGQNADYESLQRRSSIFLPEEPGLSAHEHLRKKENNAYLHRFICQEIVNNFGDEFAHTDHPDMAAFAPF